MSTYEKFERLLKEQNETAASVSKETGIAKSTFSGWKHGKFVPKKEKMEMIANYFDIPVDYFYNDELYEVSAGQGRINDGADTFRPSQGRYAKVVGDSMLPTLMDGDYVSIVETTDVLPTDYAVVRINGDELTIKHVEFTDDGMWVRGENKDVFKDKFYTIKDIVLLPVQVVGKATEIIQRKL